MKAKRFCSSPAGQWFLAALASLALAASGYAHPGCGSSGCADKGGPQPTRYGEGGGSKFGFDKPEPYGGQKVCPVCGTALGTRGAPVTVETIRPVAAKPSFWVRLFRRPPPGIPIYVCGPECVAPVKSDPGGYLTKVIAARGTAAR